MNGTPDVANGPGPAASLEDTGPVDLAGDPVHGCGPDRVLDTSPLPRVPGAGHHRHRPTPDSWTPAPSGGASHARTEPMSLPIPLSSATTRTGDVEFTPASGVLPIGEEDAEAERPTIRRTTVLLAAPRSTPRSTRHLTAPDDSRIYAAPPGGLDKFDLGSVPASVTPPRTWRKAAWFASAASGAAVAAMLLAGTALMNDPAESSRAMQTWPDHSSPQPTLPSDGGNGTPRTDQHTAAERATEDSRESDAAPRDGEDQPAAHQSNNASPAPADNAAGHLDGGEPEGGQGDPGAPSSDVPPMVKPPVTPAPTESAPVVLWAPHDTDTLAQRSQDFLNTVTEDPEAAHALTTGDLAAQGVEGLAERYSDVAYFEVREVYVDPNRGYTLNTVEVTYVDGSTEEQTRKLVFGDDDLIEADTQ